MLHQRFDLTATGYMTTYILDDSDQIQLGRRRPVALICPGGAYLRTSDQEAEQVALRFTTLGCHAAILRYSCGDDILRDAEPGALPRPFAEIGLALALLRERAGEWRIDPDRVIVNGYSAGGHLCAMACTRSADIAKAIGKRPEDVKPNAAVLGYPCIDLEADMLFCDIEAFSVGEIDREDPIRTVYPLFRPAFRVIDGEPKMDFRQAMLRVMFGSDVPSRDALRAYSPHLLVNRDTPPAFVWTTANDDLVPADNAMKYVYALWHNRVPCEFHMFGEGHHGLSLADETVADSPGMVNPEVARWFELAKSWMKRNGMIP